VQLEFGEFQLDLERYSLRRGGEPVKIEPKVFDVLRYLVLHRDRVVGKDELLGALWPGEHVVEGVVARCIYALRKAFGEREDGDAVLATVRGRGYRFVADIRVVVPSGAPPRDPFVGRGEEMARLGAALASARAGRGRIVWLTGEAGIGKTRLADELADGARVSAVAVWVARCHEHEGAPPFWLWTQVVRACLEEHRDGEVRRVLGAAFAEVARIVPELAPSDSGAATGASDSVEGAPYRLFDAVAVLLRLSTARTPHLLVIDDAHWADAASLQLLAFLATEVASWSLCIVITAREEIWREDDARRASLAQLSRQRCFERIEPRPLSAQAVAEYVTRMLGQPSAEVADLLHRTSEGNPFFMVETLRARSRDATGPVAAGELPSAVKDVVGRRLADVPAATRAALDAAAVVGRTFDLRTVAEALAMEPRAVLAALEPAIGARLVAATARHHGRFAFGHGLVREALYAALSASRRTALHARVGAALERETPAPVAEIAQHFLRALPDGDASRAVAYCRRAGAAATSVHAHAAAAAAYDDALAVLDHVVGPDASGMRHELLLARGDACRMDGRIGEAKETYAAAADLARRAGRSSDLALAAIGLRDCESSRAVPDAAVFALLEEAIRALPEGDVILRARLYGRMAAVRDVDARRAWSDRAAELVTRAGDPAAEADVLRARLHALQGPAELDLRAGVAAALMELADRQGRPAWSWEARLARYDVLLRRGDMRAADGELAACAELADRLRHPQWRMEVDRHRAQRALSSGRYAEAEKGIEETARMAERLQSPFGRFYFSAQMLWLLRDKGLLQLVQGEGERFVAGHPWVEVTARATVGVLHLECGDSDRARACFAYYAHADFENVPYGEDYVAVLAQLAHLCAALGERTRAARLHEMLAPYAAQNVANGPLLSLGSATHFVALLDAALGRTADARATFERALDTNERWNALPALVRTREAYAAFLEGEGEAARVTTLREGARVLRAELGMGAT
jgi:DNA-binding winged helix-turn-helix (wHTH) protein/tetratricopeptide (TPR) repeat protein